MNLCILKGSCINRKQLSCLQKKLWLNICFAGDTHVCGVLQNGKMKCFGTNANGELGYEDKRARGDGPGIETGNNLEFVDLGSNFKGLARVCGKKSYLCSVDRQTYKVLWSK